MKLFFQLIFIAILPLFDVLGGRMLNGPPLPSIALRNLVNESRLFVGSASNAKHIREDDEYDRLLKQQFSLTTPENSCKWRYIHPLPSQFNFTDCDLIVSTATTNKQKVRGHNLCWGHGNPQWLEDLAGNASALEAALSKHISTVAGRYAGRLYAWDVVNEAVLDHPTPSEVLKTNVWYPTVPNYIDRAFQLAYAADSSAKLFYNDYNAEVINNKSNAIYDMVKGMLQRGIPIHGVGLQSHFLLNVNKETSAQSENSHHSKGEDQEMEHARRSQPDRTTIYSPIPSDWQSVSDNIKRFVDLGLEVHITEMDVKVTGSAPDPEKLKQQAVVYAKVLLACLDHAPKCRSFEVWGFIDKYSWIASKEIPDLFDENYLPKPSFYSVANELNSSSQPYLLP